MNTVWYQDIADHAFAVTEGETSHRRVQLSIGDRIVTEIYRMLMILVFIVQIYLLFLIPYIGIGIYFVHFCWLVSTYCFEYRWTHLGWKSPERVRYFQDHWVYFLGFGFPVALLSCISPKFIDGGVFALIFPICMLTASVAQPMRWKNARFGSLPILAASDFVTSAILKIVEKRQPNNSVSRFYLG